MCFRLASGFCLFHWCVSFWLSLIQIWSSFAHVHLGKLKCRFDLLALAVTSGSAGARGTRSWRKKRKKGGEKKSCLCYNLETITWDIESKKLSRIGDCFLAILPISGSKRSAINLALIVGEGLAWGHHLALFGRTSQWQQFSGRWRLGGTDSDPNHEEVSSRRHVCPWSRLACRSGSPFPTRCRTHHQDSPGSPKCQPCRLPQSLSKRLFESRHSPATSHLCHLLAWVKGYIRSARRWCKIEQKQPLLNWLVVLTISKVMKVNGKDYPIYYGK